VHDRSPRVFRSHVIPGCEAIFDGSTYVFEDTRENYGEQRLWVTGWLRNMVVTITYTECEDDFHLISLRKSEKDEVKRYIEEAVAAQRCQGERGPKVSPTKQLVSVR
jgi:uncharacterized DUF497 family protein